MGNNSMEKFIDEFDVDSKVYIILSFVAALVVAGMLLINTRLEQNNKVTGLQVQNSELVAQQ